jgi:[acyl-carrier-protein] S-malonyltransferase
MAEPAAKFADLVDRARVRAPSWPVIGNVQATSLACEAEVRAELRAQMCSPVRWSDCVGQLQAAGVTRYIEVGPGKVLKGLLLRNLRDAQCLTTETPRDIEVLLRAVEAT